MRKMGWIAGLAIVALLAIFVGPRGYEYATKRSYATTPFQATNVGPSVELATFAGGCFWCMEPPFEKIKGVKAVISGYTGGYTMNPSYEQVVTGTTGHIESVQVIYDPQLVSYEELLAVYWRQIDPTDIDGQFVDRGEQYVSMIFYHNEAQERAAIKSRAELAQSGRFDSPIVTMIQHAEIFYEAEEYHQDYYKKNPLLYNYYRSHSGRDEFLEEVWGDEPDVSSVADALRARLTPIQYHVTQEDGTEEPYHNEYWDFKGEGIYVDIVSGEPLFSSIDKYDSGTGWPSFTKPLAPENIVEREDRTLFMVRIEVRSKAADSHLGHVFPDGPKPTGLRYCMNSAALRFVPKERLAEEGYEQFVHLFA